MPRAIVQLGEGRTLIEYDLQEGVLVDLRHADVDDGEELLQAIGAIEAFHDPLLLVLVEVAGEDEVAEVKLEAGLVREREMSLFLERFSRGILERRLVHETELLCVPPQITVIHI